MLVEGIKTLTEDHVKVIMYNLLSSMRFFHAADLMHRDIKPANILIDHRCQIKLCDFGSARPIKMSFQDEDEIKSRSDQKKDLLKSDSKSGDSPIKTLGTEEDKN